MDQGELNTEILSLKRRIQELEQSEARLRYQAGLVANVFTPIISTDSQFCITYWNRAAEEVFGWTDAEVLGRSALEVFQANPSETERAEAAQQILQTGHTEGEVTYRRKDGREIICQASSSILHGEDGEFLGLVSALNDITDQKQMEKAVRESEQIYRAIGETIDYGVWVCAPDGRNLYASQSFLDLLGITQQQCSDFGWGDTLHPEDSERTIAAWKECVRTEGVWDIEHRFMGRDGQYHPILARGIPVRSEQGKIICWAGINLDIGRLKRLEKARLEDQVQIELQRRLMEQREMDRQAMARDIHDGPVQTLSSALFNIQFAKEAFSDPLLDAELEQVARSIKNAVQELRQVIFELRPPSVLRFGFAQAIRFHANELHERNPELTVVLKLENVGQGLSELACLTMYRIYQEAMTNVVRHSGAAKAWVRLSAKDGSLILHIRDNGKGLPVEFNPDRLTKSGHYGLAGIKERVDLLAGKLSVTSHPGKGTSLQVTIPL